MNWKTEALAEVDEGIIVHEDISGALIGYVERCGQPPIAVYDAEKVVGIFIRAGATADEAQEMFEHNYSGAWIGERTPGWFYRLKKAR